MKKILAWVVFLAGCAALGVAAKAGLLAALAH